MPTKEILHEFEMMLKQRGELTAEQRKYARLEEQVMDELYPLTKPNEEKRFSHLRTLDRYIGSDTCEDISEEIVEEALSGISA